jgi:beta-glucuronidase
MKLITTERPNYDRLQFFRGTCLIPIFLLALFPFGIAAKAAFAENVAAVTQNPTLLVDIDHRTAASLDGQWHFMVDPYQTGLYSFHNEIRKDGYFKNAHPLPGGPLVEYDFDKTSTIQVPGDWNTQRPELFYYEGLLWYQRNFDFQPDPSKRTFLHIGAANYRSHVWVNGQFLCQHEGGFTPFDCEATTVLHPGKNFIVIAVDDTRIPDGIPTIQTDWFNYGGLTRDVSLVSVPKEFIDDFDLHLKRGGENVIEGWVHVEGGKPGQEVIVALPEEKVNLTAKLDETSKAAVNFQVPQLQLWSPSNPKLYRVELHTAEDTLSDDIGFRTIEVKGDQILLNGKAVAMRGMSVHAEAPYRTGRTYSEKDVETLLDWAQELGANYLRLAHYPHDERMTRLADRKGIMIWSEIPVYWACQFDNPAVYDKAKQQLTEMIRRDRNKASVMLWSIANETPLNEARTQFLKSLVSVAHELDPTRPVTAALLVHGAAGQTKVVDDPLGEYLDVIGINEYIGWYEGKPEDADTTHWDIHYDKPLFVSEFGADAKNGLHGSPDARWTEEYQANVYRHQLEMLRNMPHLRGMSPWILMDFRSPRRPLPGIEDGFNRKGLISDQGQKKQAFSVLQKAYQKGDLPSPSDQKKSD